ncbi:MAG: hypothetical protein AB201_00030 [Parcubacteria bacterium C7867-006]|nr:MAG: hypothetical protein AB201_00030 [Parcubacteria bacterium C7867-006]
MFNIEQYLKRFSKGIESIKVNKENIVLIINKYTNLNINSSDIEIKDYKIIVNTSAVGKSQLFLNKNKILQEINSSIKTKVVDIK